MKSGHTIHASPDPLHCNQQRCDDVIHVNGQQIDLLIARVDQIAPWHTPLFRAARDGALTLLMCERGAVITPRLLRELPQPAVILLSDDDECSTGPTGWPCTGRVMQWARAAFLHCAGGEAMHYALVVRLALKHRRLALIESSSAYVDDWCVRAAGKIAGAVLTRPDVSHPIAHAPGAVQ